MFRHTTASAKQYFPAINDQLIFSKMLAMKEPTTPLPFIGTVGNITIFRLYGRYYVRTRSSLTGRRVKRDPAFRVTMQHAALLAKASRIAAQVYALVPPTRKKHPLYRKLTGEAMTWLKHGWEEKDITGYLSRRYISEVLIISWPVTSLTGLDHGSAACPHSRGRALPQPVTWQRNTQNLQFHVTAGIIGNSDTWRASTCKVPS